MERLVKGDIIVVDFPFSDYSETKKRPVVVIATMTGDDILVAQISAVVRDDEYTIIFENKDLKIGNLRRISRIRANKLFTIDKSLISYKIGSLKEEKIKEMEGNIIAMIRK